MKDIPRVGFVCTGETALELSGAICCAGRLMRHFTDNGYMTGGCYSCISPSKQAGVLRERIANMCACNDVVVTVGCEGFREGDVMPDIVNSLCRKDLPYFVCKLSADEYTDADTGIRHKCYPSRATAAMYLGSVVLNVSSDLPSSLGKLNELMPSLGFAVRNAGVRAPANSLKLEDLVSGYCSETMFQD